MLSPSPPPNELAVRPLPGNKPCPYPPEAQKSYVAGPVHFVVQVRPDGTAESVEVKKVPLPDLGFEATVRACLADWRFEPASGGAAPMRSYEGEFRFRLDGAEETAVRALLETLAGAWNAGDLKAVEDLALRSGDAPAMPSELSRSLGEQLQPRGTERPWRMELEPEVENLRFLRADLVSVRQRYRRTAAGPQGAQGPAESAVLDAVAAKGSRGWRFVRISPMETEWLSALRVGATIRAPRKVKDVKPDYPILARELHLQGAVILECVISAEGNVTAVRLLRGVQKVLDDAAIAAVKRWRYTPTLLDGKPVPVIMTVTVNFKAY